MRDRIPVDPGRVKMTRSDGTFEYVTLERADNPTQEGTPLNKALLDYAVAACGVTAGTATALTLDDAFGGFTLVDGAKVNFRLHVASGANPTLNVNGTGAKALVDAFANPMPSGVAAGAWIEARYSSVYNQYIVTGSANMRMVVKETLTADANSIEIPLTQELKFAKVIVSDLSVYAPIDSFLYVRVNAASNGDKYIRQSKLTFSQTGGANTYTYNQNGYIFNPVQIGNDGSMEIEFVFDGMTASCVAHADMVADNAIKTTSNGNVTFSSGTQRVLTISANASNRILAGAKFIVYGGY